MAIHSMTGFGSARARVGEWDVRIEIKALNHKSLDLRLSLPHSFSQMEPRLTQFIKKRCHRGRIMVHVDADQRAHHDAPFSVDEERFGALATQLKRLAAAHDLDARVSLSDLLALRALFETAAPKECAPEDEGAFDALMEQALDRFIETRRSEGEAIAADLHAHLDTLRDGLSRVRLLRPELLDEYRDRLVSKLDEIAQSHGIAIDRDRVIHEIILFADRSDIAEELQRAEAHIERIAHLLTQESRPHGKKLDFYLQEMIRETNTMGSKSNLTPLTQVIVPMKAAVEQMREQTANIE